MRIPGGAITGSRCYATSSGCSAASPICRACRARRARLPAMRALRSLLFTTYMMVSACLFGLFMTLCFWLPYRGHFAIARTWARCLLWMLERLCGLGFVVEGRDRIPQGNHIIMSNHASAWETVAQFVIFPPQVWVLKRGLLWIPFVGWALKLLRPSARHSHRQVGGPAIP